VAVVGEALNRGRLAMISPSATRPNLNTGAWDVFHRTTPDDNAEGEAAGHVIQTVLRARRVFVVKDNSPYGATLAAKAKQILGDGVVGSATLTEGAPSVASRIRTSGATAVFVGGSADHAGTLLKEMRARGITATMIGADAINAGALVNAAGPANAEGTLLVCSCVDASGLDQSFVRSYQSRFGRPPGVYAGPAYDATTIFLTGLAAGVSDRAAMLRHVHQYQGDGVAGSYRFTSNGDLDPNITRVWTFKVHNGQATPVGPAPRT
jgi:branched-chain amino acid transport system substrate-binding protein